MHHPLACGHKVIGDDSAVTPPPDCFGAHDHARSLRAAFAEPRQAGSEWRGQSVVCVVAKAAHPPKTIGRGLRATRLSSQAAEFADMLISDLPRRQGLGKLFLIELRVSPRPRHRPYVDNEADAGIAQEIDKFEDRPGRVAYGEKSVRLVAPGGKGA